VKLSVLVPVYNEAATVESALERILGVDYPCDVEVVLVDDGSIDGTDAVLSSISDPRLAQHRHVRNRGKGAAIRTAAEVATGDYMIICDADLEYSPEEIPSLLDPILAGQAEVVYGTRTFGSHTAYSFWYVMGNKAVTMFANVLYNSWISDLETCFKLMPLPLYRSLRVRPSTGTREFRCTTVSAAPSTTSAASSGPPDNGSTCEVMPYLARPKAQQDPQCFYAVLPRELLAVLT
jgi:glycosyltransferase involved in cell wall biosynthesis